MKDEKICNYLHDNYCDFVSVTPDRKAIRDLELKNDVELDAEFTTFFAISDRYVAQDLIDHYDLPVYVYEPLDCWLIEVDGNAGEAMRIHEIN